MTHWIKKNHYNVIIGRYFLIYLGIDLNYSQNIIECGIELYQEYTGYMVDLNKYILLSMWEGNSETKEEAFFNEYLEEHYGSMHPKNQLNVSKSF